MIARSKKVLKGALIVFLVGVLYTVFIHLTGISIPCVFKLVTGFKCPGCGVSAMCLSLMRFNFKKAFLSNNVLFCLLPFMAAVAGRLIYVYIKTGKTRDRFSDISIWIMIVILIVWGILRNII